MERGKIDEPVREGRMIQGQLEKSAKTLNDAALARRFASMVFNNNLKGAMSLVADKTKRGVLPLDDNTKSEMSKKHPKAEPVYPDALLSGPVPESMHKTLYEALNGELIKKCALRTKGSAGVSQQEDNLWHKMVTAHKATSSTLCNAVAQVALRLSTEYVDPDGLEALLANRGIAKQKPWAPTCGRGRGDQASYWQSSHVSHWRGSAKVSGCSSAEHRAASWCRVCHSCDARLSCRRLQ